MMPIRYPFEHHHMIAIVTPEQQMHRIKLNAMKAAGRVADDRKADGIRRCIQAGQRLDKIAQAFGMDPEQVRFVARRAA